MTRTVPKTGDARAADPGYEFFPLMVASMFFLGSVVVGFVRTSSAARASSTTTFVNAHFIAFPSLYFWIIPAVFINSVVS